MQKIQFIIFFSIVIGLYSLLSFYIYSKGIQVFPEGTSTRIYYKYLFLFLSASYIIARFLERIWLSVMSDVFTWIGSIWLAAFFYFLLIAIAIDLIRLLNYIIPFLPEMVKSTDFKRNLFWTINGIVAVVLPDLVLLGGDIVDEDLGPVIRSNLGDSLKKLKAPLGVIGVTGNHEYIGGADQAVKYLSDHGVKMIQDTIFIINNKICIVGREDRDKRNFAGTKRKDFQEVMKDVNHNLPVILLDHQPFELDEKAKAGVDLTLSGHTHHGQMWPLNYITKAIFEVSWGYKKKENMHVYVSSGVGGWGPPVRVGNRPEIVLIHLKFKE